ncbi:MAG TPA: ABC transporter permease [Pyrinomonadaceae bacterium]|nr:ABC transporter permease [Pyrinomonadaceae bacterium]
MAAFPQDLKFGLRMLLRRPLLTAGISLSLALGIGANSAVFSLVDAILFRPMNIGDSSRLVSLYTSDYSGSQYSASSFPDFVDFRDRSNVFENVAAFTEISTTLRSENYADRTDGVLVSGNYFDLLDVKAARGRTFHAEEDQTPGTHPVIVISHKLWQTRFAGDPSLIGKTIFLNNNNFTIIGITPETFTGTDLGRSPEIFVPMQMYVQVGLEPGFITSRGIRMFSVLGRLRSDVSEDQAQTSLNLLAGQLAAAYPDHWKERNQEPRKISVIAERYARVRPEVRSVLMGLAGLFTTLTALVLLIACSNISNMLLARATARQREMAVRTALGASRGRLIRQLLTESLQLSLIGSVLGILLAPICIKLLIAAFLPGSTTELPFDIGIDQRVILLTLGIGLFTGLIFGLVPALHASKSDLNLAMKDESSVMQTGRRRFGMRNLFVITQISASLLLMIVAGLFVRSLQKAQQVDLGYNVDNVLTVRPDAEFLDNRDTGPQLVFYNQVLERIRTLPGVEAVSLADFIPSGGGLRRSTISVENYTPRTNENMDVRIGVVAPDYFRTMGMTLTTGREFLEHDKDGAPRTAIVNESLARRYWPGENALGKHLTLGGSKRQPLEVIGVVNDATAYIFEKDASPFLYLPLLQNPSLGMTLHVRSKGDPMALLSPVRNEIEALGQNVVLRDPKPLSEPLNDSLLSLRLASTLTGIFGLLALALAMVGIFAVVNYSTTRRTREIGIRMAVGAQRADILHMIMKEGLFIVVAGVVVGLLLAFVSARLIASFLFADAGSDMSVYVVIALLQIAIAMLACFIPAYKATKIDPTEALRHD